MVRDKYEITWGDTGTQPTDGSDHRSGEKPDAQIFDWYWYNTIDKINTIWDEFDRLDSNDDGTVDKADYAIDAGDADTVDGQDFADIKTWVNNNADVPNSDHTDEADNADTVDGQDFADIQTWVNNNADVPNADDADTVDGLLPGEVPHFATESDIDVSSGQLAIADDTGNLYYEDGK